MSAINSLKVIASYYRTLLRRYLPLRESKKLEGICNYIKIDDAIATAGQPTEAQLQLVKSAGFATIINLAPPTAANALPDERAVVSDLGMGYINIPVDFKNPTAGDFEKFCAAMQQVGDRPVFVHCAANMRVSAFIYRYRYQIRGEDRSVAATDLHKIWSPVGVWKTFIDER